MVNDITPATEPVSAERPYFCELDRATIDHHRAAIFVAEFIVWWFQAGRVFYRGNDDGLEEFARDAVDSAGGWRAARRIIRSAHVPRG